MCRGIPLPFQFMVEKHHKSSCFSAEEDFRPFNYTAIFDIMAWFRLDRQDDTFVLPCGQVIGRIHVNAYMRLVAGLSVNLVFSIEIKHSFMG
jgi:hypothetical protein